MMYPYYTTADGIIDHPLNLQWEEVRRMNRSEFEMWWRKVCKMLAKNYYEKGIPPKAGKTELKLLKQFRTITELDVTNQLGRDENDGSRVYLNTIKISAADHFFPNIFEAKDKMGKDWISVIDQLTNPSLAMDKMWSSIRNDSMKMYSELVPATGHIEDYLRSMKKEYGFVFIKPASITKKYHKKFRIKLGVLKSLIKRRVVTRDCIEGLEKISDITNVYMLRYSKETKVFPNAFTLLKTAKVSAPTNFPAVVARSIYSNYANPRTKGEEITIWDPSMGFGGRLLGALSLVDKKIHYVGTDPNSLNYFSREKTSRYEFLEKTFKNEIHERRSTFRGTYLQTGSEDAERDPEFRKLKGKIDLVFTSPPYFSAELYSDDDTQSSIKFDSYNAWREQFLAPTLKTAAEWIRVGGCIVWNIANSGGYPLEEDTRHICRQLGLDLIATEKMIIATGAGSKKQKNGTLTFWNFATIGGKVRKYEPVYVFKKIKCVPKIRKFSFSKLHKMVD